MTRLPPSFTGTVNIGSCLPGSGNIERGVDFVAELQTIYDSEIYVRIGWFWDDGFDARLGGELNGFLAAETLR